MRKISKTVLAAATAATTGIFALSAHAQQTWNVTEALGPFNWAEDLNWTPGPYPNAAGITANVNNDITTPMQILIPGGDGATVGILNLGDASTPPPPADPPNPDQKFTLGTATGGAGTMIFDNGASDAQLNATKHILSTATLTDFDQLGTNLVLNSNLSITANAAGATVGNIVQIRGKISDGVNGPRGLIINGTGFTELRSGGEANTYTGKTIINSGRLRLLSGSNINLIVGDVEVNNFCILQDGGGSGNVLGDNININLIHGQYNPGFSSATRVETIGSLQADDPLTGHLSQTGGGQGTVTFGGNNLDKTYNGLFTSQTSWTKVGTGVQTIGGSAPSNISSSTQAAGAWTVLGGRLDLNKPDGVTSLAQRNLIIGNGTQVGALRPEVRLLTSEQILTRISSTVFTETTAVTLNSGVLNLNGKTETVGPIAVTGTGISNITLGATGNLSVTAGVSVADGATVEVTAGGVTAVKAAGAVAIAPTGKLDLKNNKLISTSPAGTATEGVYNGQQGDVQRAYNFGSWNGPGLTTTMQEALDGVGTIGVATGEQIRGLGPTDTDTWSGQTINGASTIAMYTYAGDANLDGQVDAGDYGILDAFIQVPGATGYANGDFNYDGFIDPADYGTIDNSIQFQGPPIQTSGSAGGLAGVTAVPEPASLSVVGLAAASLLARRRRRSR